LFPWWNGSEADFISILEMLNKIEQTDDWVVSFHDLRVMSLVLKGMNAHMPSFIYTTIKMAFVFKNMRWFTPYEQSYLELYPTDSLSIHERVFLAEMSLIERDSYTRKFSELWTHWRKIKEQCAWLPKNTSQLVRLPEVGYRRYVNFSKQWELIEKESALTEEDLRSGLCNKVFVKGRGFVTCKVGTGN